MALHCLHRGARPDRSTIAARNRARSFPKLEAIYEKMPKPSLDELEKVEKHLNKGKPLSNWLGIRVYKPER